MDMVMHGPSLFVSQNASNITLIICKTEAFHVPVNLVLSDGLLHFVSLKTWEKHMFDTRMHNEIRCMHFRINFLPV